MAIGGPWDAIGPIIFDIESSFDPKWAQTLGIQMLKSRGPVRANTQDVIYTLQTPQTIMGHTLQIVHLHAVRDPQALGRWCRQQWGEPGEVWGSLTFAEPQFRINERIWLSGEEQLAAWSLTWT